MKKISLKNLIFTQFDSSPNLIQNWGVTKNLTPTSLSILKLREKYNLTGKGIKVAILDTGVYTEHNFLKGTITEKKNFTTRVVIKGRVGRRIKYSIECDEGDTNDAIGHGSHCTGVVKCKNLDLCVAPECDIYIGKVLNDKGEGTEGELIRGLEWAIASKVDVINMSLGFEGTVTPALREVIQRAIDNNIIVVCSAGNEGPKSNSLTAPAKITDLIAVGATDYTNSIADFSSKGSQLDIVAPGVNILGCYNTSENSLAYMSGTSMAAPFISGVAALFLEYTQRENKQPPSGQTMCSFFESFCKEASIDLGITGFDHTF